MSFILLTTVAFDRCDFSFLPGRYQGLIKKRSRDTVNAGWVYAKTSRYIPNATAAKLFEAKY